MLPPRRALELLARDPRGATGHLLMIAHRFEMKMLAGLVHEGLAEAKVGGRGRPVLDHGRGAEGDRRPLGVPAMARLGQRTVRQLCRLRVIIWALDAIPADAGHRCPALLPTRVITGHR